MRFSRAALLARLAGDDSPGLVLLEAPSGFGKSWLARRLAPSGALRARGELPPRDEIERGDVPGVVIDDAHLLKSADLDDLIELIEDSSDGLRLIVAGRFLPDALHEAAHLVDGVILDAAAMSITIDEVLAEAPEIDADSADRIVTAAEGSVRIVAILLDQLRNDPTADAVLTAHQLVRTAATSALQQLSPSDGELVSLLARTHGFDRFLLDKLGGAGFLERVVDAGVPMRRQAAGGIALGNEESYRTPVVDTVAAGRLATELLARGQAIDAAGVLLDAGAHDRAARMLAELPESIIDTTEPRRLMALLARLGTAVEDDAALLLLRGAGAKRIGRLDQASTDIARAMRLVERSDSPLQRRVAVWHADQLWAQGRLEEAERAASDALVNLGPGEDLTLAAAHHVLASIASSSDGRDDLQRAANEYRIAISAWEGAGERARARHARTNLAAGALVPLGRFEEALAQLSQVLAMPDVSDAERLWAVYYEGLALYHANRLDSAEARFRRVGDVGRLQDDSQLVASAAWANALVAARRDDLNATLRQISVAENTALGESDDVLGVPFLCDVSVVIGGLGELDIAKRYLDAATERSGVFPDQIAFARFAYDARCGRSVDVEAQLRRTPPMEYWRVELLGAVSAVHRGDRSGADRHVVAAQRELVALGLSDFAALGERRAGELVASFLRADPNPPAAVDEPAPAQPTSISRSAPAARPSSGRRLVVIGGTMTVHDGDEQAPVPPGNPQRLVGAVVAFGGSATFDQLSDAIWGDDDVESSRARLRNVLLRLRRGAGDVVVRSGSGVRLAPDLTCDIHEFERLASDALAAARSDPDLAGHLAETAVGMIDGVVFADFEYEEWAMSARRRVDQKLIGLFDLLSIQAEDAGNLPLAQAYAERAVRIDRYADSRYVRLAELLTMQGRNAAAVAVLEDASEVARELGGAQPAELVKRRDALVRRAASS
jgi:DNA-binding SARP family transcriptional activator